MSNDVLRSWSLDPQPAAASRSLAFVGSPRLQYRMARAKLLLLVCGVRLTPLRLASLWRPLAGSPAPLRVLGWGPRPSLARLLASLKRGPSPAFVLARPLRYAPGSATLRHSGVPPAAGAGSLSLPRRAPLRFAWRGGSVGRYAPSRPRPPQSGRSPAHAGLSSVSPRLDGRFSTFRRRAPHALGYPSVRHPRVRPCGCLKS